MQRAPIALQPRLAARATAGHTTSVWQIRGVLPWLDALSEAAIHHQSSLLFFIIIFILRRMGKNTALAPTLPRIRHMSCFDLTHAPVATTARAAATGLVSMSTRPDPEGSGTVEIATRRCPRLRVSPPLSSALLCMLCHAYDVSRVWRAP